jgi:integrase
MHVPLADVAVLLDTTERLVEKAGSALDGSVTSWKRLHKAEQVRLVTRLAADSGARRGELAALQWRDLDGRVLTIERGVSGEEVGPTKTRRVRRLTLGCTTAELWNASEEMWNARLSDGSGLGEWLFSKDFDHRKRLTAGGLSHWFAELCNEAGLPGVSLHRLRHTVATFLVGRGDLLRAQQRLGHRDASTTLRNYAHALPLEDQDIADDIDEMLRTELDSREHLAPPSATKRASLHEGNPMRSWQPSKVKLLSAETCSPPHPGPTLTT